MLDFGGVAIGFPDKWQGAKVAVASLGLRWSHDWSTSLKNKGLIAGPTLRETNGFHKPWSTKAIFLRGVPWGGGWLISHNCRKEKKDTQNPTGWATGNFPVGGLSKKWKDSSTIWQAEKMKHWKRFQVVSVAKFSGNSYTLMTQIPLVAAISSSFFHRNTWKNVGHWEILNLRLPQDLPIWAYHEFRISIPPFLALWQQGLSQQN